MLVDHIRQPFRNGEAFVFSIRNRFQESRADVLPVEVGDPISRWVEKRLAISVRLSDKTQVCRYR